MVLLVSLLQALLRKEIDGIRKTRSLIGYGVGMRVREKGYRARRLVRGNAIGPDTIQVNTVIEQFGSKSVDEIFKPKEKKE